MGKKTANIEEIKEFLRRISKKYKIRRAIIFGSAARGEFGEDSDVDLIIVSDFFKDKSPLERPVPLYLEWDLDYPVDFICYTIEEFEKIKKRPSIVKIALEEGIIFDF
ncbi:MAG: nucleotidyltransferase domain-containing protein [Candidatus Asgardarchaeia archaeon]